MRKKIATLMMVTAIATTTLTGCSNPFTSSSDETQSATKEKSAAQIAAEEAEDIEERLSAAKELAAETIYYVDGTTVDWSNVTADDIANAGESTAQSDGEVFVSACFDKYEAINWKKATDEEKSEVEAFIDSVNDNYKKAGEYLDTYINGEKSLFEEGGMFAGIDEYMSDDQTNELWTILGEVESLRNDGKYLSAYNKFSEASTFMSAVINDAIEEVQAQAAEENAKTASSSSSTSTKNNTSSSSSSDWYSTLYAEGMAYAQSGAVHSLYDGSPMRECEYPVFAKMYAYWQHNAGCSLEDVAHDVWCDMDWQKALLRANGYDPYNVGPRYKDNISYIDKSLNEIVWVGITQEEYFRITGDDGSSMITN